MDFLREIKDVLFPKFCLGCGKEGTYLCPDCQALIDISEGHYCLCSSPHSLPHPGKCSKCRNNPLDGLYSACSLQNPLVRKLIYHLEHHLIKDIGEPLSDLIIAHFKLSYNDPNQIWEEGILVPLPLSRTEIKQKGFNPAQEIAIHLSTKLSIPLISEGLIKASLGQTKLNFPRAPEILKVKNVESIRGRKILLVDKTYSDGKIMNQGAKALKQAGASQIWGVTVARE